MSIFSFSKIVRLSAVALMAFSSASFAKGELRLINEAMQEIKVERFNGDIDIKRVPVEKVLPGSEIVYVVTYENVGDEPVKRVTITNPVPAVLEYVPQSASGMNADISYSADGGNNYAEMAALMVVADDGSIRSASPQDITNVRWQIRNPVQPGATGTVEYRALLK